MAFRLVGIDCPRDVALVAHRQQAFDRYVDVLAPAIAEVLVVGRQVGG